MQSAFVARYPLVIGCPSGCDEHHDHAIADVLPVDHPMVDVIALRSLSRSIEQAIQMLEETVIGPDRVPRVTVLVALSQDLESVEMCRISLARYLRYQEQRSMDSEVSSPIPEKLLHRQTTRGPGAVRT